MKDKRLMLRLLAILACVALTAAACGGGGDDPGDGDVGQDPDTVDLTDVPEGGTLKIAGASDVDYMDPAAAYYTLSWTLMRGVVRTLTTYPAVSDFEKQNVPVADLATDAGQSNEDSTEWTFTIKDGVKYGKALGGEDVAGVTGEEIVCEDFVNATERIFTSSVGAGYPFYYDIIEGAKDFQDGKADTISGVTCPDEKTVVFTLTEPAGDWPYRTAMPALSPIPAAASEKHDAKKVSEYGDHMVATGPYYIAEWTPGEHIQLERNEHWDAETDEVRKAYVDSVDWKLGFENDVGVKKVQDGDYHMGLDVSPQGPALEQTLQDEVLKKRFINEPSLCTRYIFLNTTVEPFDDLLVREAVNLAIDRAALKRLQGGPVTGEIATSIIPPGIAGALEAADYNPFGTPNMQGDLEAAKAKMEEAGLGDGYDKPILVVGASDPPHDKYFESVRKNLEDLGFSNIESKLPAFPNQYTQFYQEPSKKVAIGTSAGWCKDYNDAFTFLDPLFHGDNILPSGNQNYSSLDDPELNELIDTAAATPPGPERTAAWETANKAATESAVWVPWTWDHETIIY
ncbi:MAG: ABC transporter substrate-binding protein, partial [Actinomycetota bacterium]|nr:ABC transporter substrate-binding protein [Actinomycetota bacterium]